MPQNTPRAETEQQLIERAKTDPAAFGEIFDQYYKPVLNYVVRRTGDVSVAQDITSEVFLKALHGLPRFQWRGVPISAWLYRIAINELRIYYRKNRYTSSLEVLQETTGYEPVDDRDIALELIEAQEAVNRNGEFITAQKLITQLPIKYQEVLSLRFGEDKKISEIAQILNKREGTVKSLLSRAIARLRREMQPNTANRIIDSEGYTNQDEI